MSTACGTTRQAEYDRIIRSFDVLDIPQPIRAEIMEALDSDRWDWFGDCDGCTAVSEVYWPTKYFPPCLRHDYDYIIGKGDWRASARFYRIQRAYGMSRVQSGIRAFAVTVAWYVWYQWRRRPRQ